MISIPGTLRQQELKKRIETAFQSDTVLKTTSLSGSLKRLLIAEFAQTEKHLLVLLPDLKSVNEYRVEFTLLGCGKPVIQITEFSQDYLQEKLSGLSKTGTAIIVSTVNLLLQKLPAEDSITKNLTILEAGGDTGYDELLGFLNLSGYISDKFVGVPGDFAQRGAIVDFWSYSESMPVRIEFDGDFIASLRYFDPESQRSIEKVDTVTLSPKIEKTEEDAAASDIFDYLDKPVVFIEQFELDALEEGNITANAVPDELPVITNDPEFEELEKELVRELPQQEENDSPGIISLSNLPGKNNSRWLIEEEISSKADMRLPYQDPPGISGSYKILSQTIIDYAAKGFRILLASENEIQSKRLHDLLIELSSDLEDLIDGGALKLINLPVKEGFIDTQKKLLLLTDYQIFGKPYRSTIPSEKKKKRGRGKEFTSINNGDFVVHEEYGIGRYQGLHTIKIGDTYQESMKLLYAEKGIVYVNLSYLHLVKKYSAKEGIVPSLSQLGSNEWNNKKKKTKKKIKEIARDLIELYAKRKSAPGYAFSDDSIWQRELEASFIYEDTIDQAKVTEEIKNDMQAKNPMDRLICGDVGFGKTEVAVRAAFKAVQDGKQVAVLVPTTILAEQHFNTFRDRLSHYPVKVDVLSRFRKKAQQTEIVEKLHEGKIDIVVGTHRLLSKDIGFKDLGLLIIDEEHRFGVKAKEKLRSLKVNVDTITMTATPIPRTLNLSLLGARDLSVIGTPPPNRQPIFTRLELFDINKIRDWVLDEIKRGGQIYIVHDRVQTIEKFAAYLHKYIPGMKSGIAHGQMKPAELENVVHGFLEKKFDVLISTKIIESGLDIPNVNTIIVNRADRFGLAELHQLRGRVGRSERQAYAYLLVPSFKALKKTTLKKLKAIEEFSELGAGLNLSMRDLEIRGAGNLLGTAQSGFINEIGFDLYVKLINEAVEELKYEEFRDVFKDLPRPEERTDPKIDTFFDIGIPSAYMPDQMDRLSFYTSLLSIKSIYEMNDIRDELIDRFGSIPKPVEYLIETARLKYYGSIALFDRIIIQKKNIFIVLPPAENEDYYDDKFPKLMNTILVKYRDKIQFNQQKTIMKLIISNTFGSPDGIFDYLISLSKEIIDLWGYTIEKTEPKTETEAIPSESVDVGIRNQT